MHTFPEAVLRRSVWRTEQLALGTTAAILAVFNTTIAVQVIATARCRTDLRTGSNATCESIWIDIVS